MSTAVILAGGKSSRMGFDKQYLCINHERIIVHQINVLSTCFDTIMIISNNHLSDHLKNHPKVEIHKDIMKYHGPLGGIHAGLKYSRDEHIFVTACDMPNISTAYIHHMKAYLNTYEGVVTSYGNWIEPFHGFYGKSMVRSIEKYLKSGKRNITDFLVMHHVFYISEAMARRYTPDWQLFNNINSRDDLISNQIDKNA